MGRRASGRGGTAWADTPSQRSLVAVLIATGGMWAMLRHSRRMLREGVSLEDGGGWTVLILSEFLVAMTALGVALS